MARKYENSIFRAKNWNHLYIHFLLSISPPCDSTLSTVRKGETERARTYHKYIKKKKKNNPHDVD